MRASLPALTADQLMSTLVDGNVTTATRDGVHQYVEQHPGDQAGLQFMVMATPEFQLN
jgi:hypothetical protein